MSLETAVEKVLPEIVDRMDELKASQDKEIAELRRSVDQWGKITRQLTELLSLKTQETEGVSASYAQLAEYLMKFVLHLNASEATMKLVERQLQQPSNVCDSPASTVKETQAALKLIQEAQTSHEQLRAVLLQIASPLREFTQSQNDPRRTSIWTEVFAWRPAVAWFSIGGVGVAAFLLLTLRMSGFDLAVRSLLSVDRRLQRMEQFWEVELPDETTNLEFEEQPMPDE